MVQAKTLSREIKYMPELCFSSGNRSRSGNRGVYSSGIIHLAWMIFLFSCERTPGRSGVAYHTEETSPPISARDASPCMRSWKTISLGTSRVSFQVMDDHKSFAWDVSGDIHVPATPGDTKGMTNSAVLSRLWSHHIGVNLTRRTIPTARQCAT